MQLNGQTGARPLSVLIKPASGRCNMACAYCFYREFPKTEPQMSGETAEALVKKAFEYAAGPVTFAFQGGEPTLCGLDFFEDFCQRADRHNTRALPVSYAIQTNGQSMDEALAKFLKKRGFLTGLSIDGTQEVHDALRISPGGSFKRATVAAGILKSAGAEFNILTVVSKQLCSHAAEAYRFFERKGFSFVQFIPCLTPEGEDPAGFPYAPSAEEYGDFLKTTFRLWHGSWRAGKYVSVRYFDNLINILLGRGAELCGLRGRCTNQFVFEADGSCYLCDFYVDDGHRLGSIHEHSFFELEAAGARSGFASPLPLPKECAACGFFTLCRGGCRRERDNTGKTRFCPGLKSFFEACLPEMMEICADIMSNNTP